MILAVIVASMALSAVAVDGGIESNESNQSNLCSAKESRETATMAT